MESPVSRGIFAVMWIVSLAAVPARAQAPTTQYDDFASGFLDPSKWIQSQICQSATTLDCSRQIGKQQLDLGARTYGSRNTDLGITYDTSSIRFANPTSIRSVEARVKIAEASATDCATNTTRSHPQFIITGSFFNTDNPMDWTGDVQAYLIIERFSDRGLLASAFLGTGFGNFFGGVALSPVDYGEAVRVALRWDPASSQFVFSLRRSNQAPIIQTISYPQTNAGPAALPFVEIGDRNFVANCISTPTVAGMNAVVDRILVNSSTTP